MIFNSIWVFDYETMLNRLLLIVVLAVGAFARPDVSHLKGHEFKKTLTSYDAPISSINNQYVSYGHHYNQQDVPSVTYLPSLVQIPQQGVLSTEILPPFFTNFGAGSGQSVVGVTPGVSSSGNNQHQIQNTQFVYQPGQGHISGGSLSSGNTQQQLHNTQFVSQTGQGQGQTSNVHGGGPSSGGHYYQIQTGLGQAPLTGVNKPQVFQNVHFVSGGGQGHGNVHGTGIGSAVNNQEHVYYFAPPDEIQHRARLRINIVPSNTKNTNVIFVKTPSSPKIIPEVVVPPHQIVEDKTKIVVLVKEHDEFVPISIPAPVPITHGKPEVLVVKYHDKNDAARVVSGVGHVVGTTLTQQDKPTFIQTIDRAQYSTVSPRFGLENTVQEVSANQANVYSVEGANKNVGLKTVEIVSSTPKIDTYGFGSQVGSTPNVFTSVTSNENLGNIKTSYGVVDVTPTVRSSTPKIETYGFGTQVVSQQRNPNVFPSVSSNENLGHTKTSYGVVDITPTVQSGEKTVSRYEVKTISDNGGNSDSNYVLKTTPSSSTSYGIQNLGTAGSHYDFQSVGNSGQQNLGVRFGGDNSGGGYSIKATDFIQINPQIDYTNVENVRKLLGGASGSNGIEIVSISKGILEGSAAGADARDAVLKTLGASGGNLFNLESSGIGKGAGEVNVRTVQYQKGGDSSFVQSTGGNYDGTRQIQIGNDVADIISGSSLST